MTARRAPVAGRPVGDAGGGWRVVTLGDVASTMDEARRLAESGAEDGTVVRALLQTGGRGRLGRSWSSPPGNVYTTVILRPDVATARAAELSIVAAVATADAVACFGGTVTLKWPNDVLLEGGKISGILLEAVTEGTRLSAVLIGIGVNVASRPDLPDRRTARIETADAESVFAALLDALGRRYRQWLREGLAGIRMAWLARGPAIGAPITISQGSGSPGTGRLDGRFAGLDPDGTLVLALADGSTRRVASGEVMQ
ncbi:biotin--[acetyl-CoA-carboxylase] ligase [Thalassobaculum sp.]|uniref:biotin--[acetyl-CoA-carboxylase] ligase n=1 Tax=Thalassobaculum sp. TaxID=2022740 RepID=UPI0032EEF743